MSPNILTICTWQVQDCFFNKQTKWIMRKLLCTGKTEKITFKMQNRVQVWIAVDWHIEQFHSEYLKIFKLLIYYKTFLLWKTQDPCRNLNKTLNCALHRARMFIQNRYFQKQWFVWNMCSYKLFHHTSAQTESATISTGFLLLCYTHGNLMSLSNC